MEQLSLAADMSIRRACGFAGLGIGSVMLGLAYDPVLSFRIGGDLMAIACGVLFFAAWRAPRRDLRHSEIWTLLPESVEARLRKAPREEWQPAMAAILRARLLWHAERIGAAALALWGVAGLVWLLRGPAG